MTLEEKQNVLELAGYTFKRYKFGNGYEAYDENGNAVEHHQGNTMEICIEDAWLHYIDIE